MTLSAAMVGWIEPKKSATMAMTSMTTDVLNARWTKAWPAEANPVSAPLRVRLMAID